ncbi:unnamed protein product [Urochloa humidicola]
MEEPAPSSLGSRTYAATAFSSTLGEAALPASSPPCSPPPPPPPPPTSPPPPIFYLSSLRCFQPRLGRRRYSISSPPQSTPPPPLLYLLSSSIYTTTAAPPSLVSLPPSSTSALLLPLLFSPLDPSEVRAALRHSAPLRHRRPIDLFMSQWCQY